MLDSNDARDVWMTTACGYLIQQVQSGNPPVLCPLCGHEFKSDLPFAISLLTVDQHTNAIGGAICEACATKPDLPGRVSGFYKQNLFAGNFYTMDVSQEVGMRKPGQD